MPTELITAEFPLNIDEETGAYSALPVTDLTSVVDQNIKMVLLTNPGERLGISTFGVGLRRYLFEMQSDITRGTNKYPPIRENILNQLSYYIPYITVGDLQINFSNVSNSMNIKIKYFISDQQTAAVFDLTLLESSSNLNF